jgi:glycosyltransferase involved in cell wall biosynthesis
MVPSRLTVILPNFNHGRLLPRALSALAAQERAADEILLIDDASSDDSLSVAATWQARLPQMRIIAQSPNAGVVATLRRGLAEATGDFVYLGAADDETRPELFARAIAALETHPRAALATAEVQLVTLDGRISGLRPAILPSREEAYFDPAATAGLLRRADHWVVAVAAVWRRTPMLEAGGIDPELGPLVDSFLARELALRHGFVFLPGVLGVWHVNPAGVSRSAAANPRTTLELVAKARARIEARIGAPYPAWYPPVFERRNRFAVARLLVTEAPGGCPDPAAIAAMTGGGALDWMAMSAARMLPGALGRMAALGWLTVRLRPMSLPLLIRTWLDRRRRPRS